MQVDFTTASGSEVSLSIRTEMTNIVDHTVMSPCWNLRVVVADKLDRTDLDLVTDPQHGLCIAGRMSPKFLIPVPAASAAAVRELVETYTAEVERRVAATVAASQRDGERMAYLRSIKGGAYDPSAY